MNVQEAIIAFSQSEKIKSSLIWISQSLDMLQSFPAEDRRGGEKMIKTITEMVAYEIHIAKRVTKEDSWTDVEKHVDMALVMIRSGVPHEGAFHLSRAMTHVTSIGHHAMSFLKAQKML
ncbi:hypothetical protein [Desulfonema magnum]|uniref:Uncharacterized protein n=1 Tax=Desulfonema magnum TaxID=45655 RepID=A0A975GQE9_9BACT|nr:hypothetical protein [Desulfonema magnum]QTA88873.1 Uncharacterized protein dnm_049200 [Desulfonema magnum]